MDRSEFGHSSLRPRGGQRTISKLLIILIFGFIVVQKFVVVWQIRLAASVDPWSGLDTTAYVELAQRVQAGDWGLGPGLYYVSPFYIYFLAFCLAITKSFTAVRIIQIVLGTVAIWFMYQTAREWFNQRAALATAILAGLTGLFTFYDALILQTGVDLFLTSAALLCLTYALKKEVTGLPAGALAKAGPWTVLAGAIFGLQTMNRPNIAIAVVLMALFVVALRKWKFAALLTAGLLIGMSPAAIRNAVVAHEFSLLSSHGGLNFYLGNGEGATGFYRYIPGITPTIKGQITDTRRVASKALGRAVTDAEASEYYMNLTWSWMAAHPGKAAFLLIRKLGWTFHAQHIALPYSYPFYQYDFPTILRFSPVGPWLLIPLGLVGLLFGDRPSSVVQRSTSPIRPARWTLDEGRWTYWAFASFVPAYAVAVALFFMSERYRLPLLVPLAIGAGAAVDLFIRHVQEKSWRALAAPAAVTVVLLVLVNVRATVDNGRWAEGLRMAGQLSLQGRYDESDAWVAKLEARTIEPGWASLQIGKQLLIKNQPERALKLLEQSNRIAPNKPDTQYSLGQALLGVGKPAEAIPQLEAGFNNGATIPLAGYHLAAAYKDVGRTADAVAIIPKIKITDDTTVADLLNAGRLAMELRAPALAAPWFEKAIEIAPTHADARLQFGVCLVVLNRYESAVDVLTDAVRLNPRSAPALGYLAYSEQQVGRINDARTHLAAALAIDPNDPMARLLAGTIK